MSGLCSDGAADAGEQLAGSAPQAMAWLALEQNGPWGAKAFTDSHLDPDLGRRIEEAAAAHATRASLIRRPGRHADDAVEGSDSRRLLVAFTRPGSSWLLEGTIPSPDDVMELDWAALRDGDVDAVRRSLPTLTPSDRSQLLVCTNGTRDLCCAAKGRPVALGVAALQPDRVWEVTHTSGHRFAPTAALLPSGTLHGRLDVAAAEELLHAADRGETVRAGHRGRSTWSAPGQVAELAVREASDEWSLDTLAVPEQREVEPFLWQVTVTHTDGRTWSVEVRSQPSGNERAESCGKGLKELRRWSTRLAPTLPSVLDRGVR